MDFDDDESAFSSVLPPALVSLTPFIPSASASPRRLSACFKQPNKPAVRAKRQLAWVSLQGRLVGAEEATSVKAIDGNGALGAGEAAAWELFTPIQRVLTVAVVAAAAADSQKSRQIFKLQKSVELRDQVLLSMQEKLDNLCQQVNHFKDQPEVVGQSDVSLTKWIESGCKMCQHHDLPPNGSSCNTSNQESNGEDVFKYKEPFSSEAEPEERRMSVLSDWAPSVASSIDVPLDSLSFEHDINSLRKECEEKEATIKQLSSFVQSSQVLHSKRITELEDIIRRKNMIINKLRKDIIILEQKVVNLSRLRRSSFPAAYSNVQHFPVMADNVLYDMDSTTGPSSDSDSSPKNRKQSVSSKGQELSGQINHKASKGDLKCNQNLFTPSPLKEISLNQKNGSVPALKPNHTTNASGENRSRRRPSARSKELAAPKRWT